MSGLSPGWGRGRWFRKDDQGVEVSESCVRHLHVFRGCVHVGTDFEPLSSKRTKQPWSEELKAEGQAWPSVTASPRSHPCC